MITYSKSVIENPKFLEKLLKLINEGNVKNICDIGGGANPILTPSVLKSTGTNCTILDVSQVELDKALPEYQKLCANVMDKEQLPANQWDIAFSQALAEHLPDGKAFHENIFDALKPGGYAFHSIPTLYSLPFVVNRIIPETFSDKLLNIIAPRDRYQHEKFPAYYSWCFGPTTKMIKRFESIGYEVVCYEGLFGHRYFERLKPLQKVNDLLSDFLIQHPIPQFTSYSQILLKKPE